jgi:nucleoside-diphosphate-sugar epimerase
MKILVTGGGGFIGAWIVSRIMAAGHDARVFDLADDRRIMREIAGADAAARLDWICGDIADTATVEKAAAGCGAIIHLAGLLTPACRANPVLGAQVNLIGTLNAFLAARAHGIGKVLYLSSVGVFGPQGGDEPKPTTLYGAFKLGGEFAASAFFIDDGIASIGFRPYVVYGPGREGGLSAGPSLACRAAARGEAYTIPFTGLTDLIHVEDVAEAFRIALAREISGAGIVNLWGERADENGVLSAIRAVVPDAGISASGPPMPIVPPSVDDSARRLLPGWKARSLAAGVADTITFYRTVMR